MFDKPADIYSRDAYNGIIAAVRSLGFLVLSGLFMFDGVMIWPRKTT